MSLFIFTSCAKIDVVNLDIEKKIRTVNYTNYKSKKIISINQKYNPKYNKWLEAKCTNGSSLENCPMNMIVFTKESLMTIHLLKDSENKKLSNQNSINSKNNNTAKEKDFGQTPFSLGD